MRLQRALSVASWIFVLAIGLGSPASVLAASQETKCADGRDDDGDGMIDCADADCVKTDICKPDGEPENTEARCSDWVDNDSNGATDCDDQDCQSPHIKACLGSWEAPAAAPASAASSTAQYATPETDNEGEHNDIDCSDGMDNDGDGFVDCEDLGCRASREVTVCRGSDGIRFGVFGRFNTLEADIEELTREAGVEADANSQRISPKFDSRWEELSVRALGRVPMLQDSFFLVKVRLEKSPKLVWFMLKAPLVDGHYLSFMTGQVSIASSAAVSNAKHILLERTYYMTSPYGLEDAATLALEGNVPGTEGRVHYAAGVSGGTGRFFAVGGRYYPDSYSENYSWKAVGALSYTPIGYWSRFNTSFIYQPVSTVLNFKVSGSYVQAAQERFPAGAAAVLFRSGYFHVKAEAAAKQELNFDSFQWSYRTELGLLLWPKTLMLAADFGGYYPGDYQDPPETIADATEDSLNGVEQYRAALHYFFWRDVGTISALYDHKVLNRADGATLCAEGDTACQELDHTLSVQVKLNF